MKGGETTSRARENTGETFGAGPASSSRSVFLRLHPGRHIRLPDHPALRARPSTSLPAPHGEKDFESRGHVALRATPSFSPWLSLTAHDAPRLGATEDSHREPATAKLGSKNDVGVEGVGGEEWSRDRI